MSLSQSLKVLISLDPSKFRSGLDSMRGSLLSFEKDLGKMSRVAEQFGNMKGAKNSFRDPIGGQFITGDKAAETAADAIETLEERLAHLQTEIEENVGAMTAHSRSLKALATDSRTASTATLALSKSTTIAAGPTYSLASAARSTSDYLVKVTDSATNAAAGLNYFGLVNYNVKAAVESWNWLSVIRGPGLLVQAYDRLRQMFFGIIPPMRLVQKTVLDLLVPGLFAIKEALDASGASSRTFTGILAESLGKAAKDIAGFGSEYKRTLLTDIRAAFQIVTGSIRSFASYTKADVDATLEALHRVPAVAMSAAGSLRDVGSAGGGIASGMKTAASATASLVGESAKIVTVRSALAAIVGVGTAAALSLGKVAFAASSAGAAAGGGGAAAGAGATAAMFSLSSALGSVLSFAGLAAKSVLVFSASTIGVVPTIAALVTLFLGWGGATKIVKTALASTTFLVGEFVKSILRAPFALVRFGASVAAAAGKILTLGAAFRKTAKDADAATQALNRSSRSASVARNAFLGLSFGLGSLGPGLGIITSIGPTAAASFALVAGAIKGIKEAANFEQTNIAFETMLKNADLAKSTIAELQHFADVTPFDTTETIASGKALLAFGFAAKDLIPNLRMIGDVASGVNVDFNELATLFGQFRAQSKIMTQDLRQLTSRGIPILEELAKGFQVPTEAIFEMAKDGQIGFEHIEAAFRSMTSAGGQFAGLMDRQSRTVGGLWSTLSSTIVIAVRDIGVALSEGLNLRGGLESLIAGAQVIQTTIVPVIASGLQTIVAYVQPILSGFYNLAVVVLQAAQSMAAWVTQIVLTQTWLKPFAISLGIVLGLMVLGPIVTGAFTSALGLLGAAIGAIVSPVGIAVIAISGLLAWIGSSFGLFDNFGKTVEMAFLMVEYGVTHFGDVWKVIMATAAYSMVAFANDVVYWISEVIPQYLTWFGNNWTNLFTDLATGTLAVMQNIWSNVKNGIKAAWDYIWSAGRQGEFVWTPLLDGFKATTQQLPTIAARQIGELESGLRKDADAAAAGLVGGFADFVKKRNQEKDAAFANQNGPPAPAIPAPPIPPGGAAFPENPMAVPFPPPRGSDESEGSKSKSKKKDAAKEGLEALVVGSSESLKQLARQRRGDDGKTTSDYQKLTVAEQKKSTRLLEQINRNLASTQLVEYNLGGA